jgi:integrase
MADIDDRWYRPVQRPDGTRERAPTPRHGIGKRWDVRWRDNAGRQRHKGFDRKADAERFIAQVTADLARGTYIDPNAGKIPLRTYGEQWFVAQTFDPSTREAVELRLRLHVYPTLGDYELWALAQRPSHIQAWMRGLQLKLAPRYVRVIFANLSALLQAAVDDGLIVRNPCRAGSVKLPALDKRRVQPWSREWVEALMQALPERYRAIATAAAGLGLRQGEVFGLAVEDIDWLRAIVHVRRQVKLIQSKTVFAPPKGGKERDIPLPESVSLRLAAHLEAHPAIEVIRPWLPTGRPEAARLLFSTRERTALDRTYFNRHVWKPALDVAEIPTTREHGMHALRHSYASVLLEDGVSIKALAEYLGHADPGFTLRTYTHLMPSSEDRVRQAVDRSFGMGSAPDVRQGVR